MRHEHEVESIGGRHEPQVLKCRLVRHLHKMQVCVSGHQPPAKRVIDPRQVEAKRGFCPAVEIDGLFDASRFQAVERFDLQRRLRNRERGIDVDRVPAILPMNLTTQLDRFAGSQVRDPHESTGRPTIQAEVEGESAEGRRIFRWWLVLVTFGRDQSRHCRRSRMLVGGREIGDEQHEDRRPGCGASSAHGHHDDWLDNIPIN